MKFYDYFRSSAAYRVRIVMNLKGVEAERVFVNLFKGEQREAAFQSVSPTGLVPVLEHDGHRIHQSLAIIDYLDALHPDPPMVPSDAAGRARVLGLALAMSADIHPLANLRVLNHVEHELGAGKDGRAAWIAHWTHLGLKGLEARLANEAETGSFCHGDAPGIADACLVPQLFFARRFDLDLDAYPTLVRIDRTCNALAAFAEAHPMQQPDAT
ncbi:MAG: maleylacetoacetate isomerase [Minwuia sp.]|nr:maleylacetoacetate isomerase [Minwuia sp.]